MSAPHLRPDGFDPFFSDRWQHCEYPGVITRLQKSVLSSERFDGIGLRPACEWFVVLAPQQCQAVAFTDRPIPLNLQLAHSGKNQSRLTAASFPKAVTVSHVKFARCCPGPPEPTETCRTRFLFRSRQAHLQWLAFAVLTHRLARQPFSSPTAENLLGTKIVAVSTFGSHLVDDMTLITASWVESVRIVSHQY